MMNAEYKPDIVLYHANCADGFGAAWACWMKWGNDVSYKAASYGEPAPDVSGLHVLIVDFSYKRDVLREMGKQARSIIVLDHHKSAQADLADWAIDDAAGSFWADDDPMKDVRRNDDHIGQPIAALFDMAKSGAKLAWEFCHENEAPTLIDLIEDRDLWRFMDARTKPFGLWLRAEPFDFQRWELIAQQLDNGRDGQRIMDEANAMQRFYDQKVGELVSMARFINIGGHRVPAVNCPPMFASEVGHALLGSYPQAPFSACYSDQGNSRGYSLRSADERQDVSEIAKKYGGGGHRNAAGFGVPA
jgi:oligoribonuclease NrnB/cAMP/cGMP phosphodiesterase (DHH superfamily)